MQKETDLIQPCIDHIKSALDVDPWAAKLAEKALRHYGRRGKWNASDVYHGYAVCTSCRGCYIDADWITDSKWGYCPSCGAKMEV